MPSHSNSSSDDDIRNPNSNSNPNPHSIDQSLDAIENQLASISMFQPDSLLNPDSEPKPEHDSREELVNGSLNDIVELPGKSSSVVEEEEKVKASSSRVRTNVSEIEEGEAPSSPSSDGYAGERGSSATSGIDDVNEDEIVEARNNGDLDGVTDAQVPWTLGKRHGDELSTAVLKWMKNPFLKSEPLV